MLPSKGLAFVQFEEEACRFVIDSGVAFRSPDAPFKRRRPDRLVSAWCLGKHGPDQRVTCVQAPLAGAGALFQRQAQCLGFIGWQPAEDPLKEIWIDRVHIYGLLNFRIKCTSAFGILLCETSGLGRGLSPPVTRARISIIGTRSTPTGAGE
jgi:hypothetical protein